ncbi:MAG: hypothetical protein NVS2B14_01340 [Chamaesiphon sp.]
MTQPRLSTFAFDVVTVDVQGREINRTRGQAQSFTEDLGSGVGLDMVLVPGGSFLMGSPPTEAESRDIERPQHLVRASPFCIGKYPVTQEQWFAVSELPKVNHDLDSNGSRFKGLKHPVEQVSWDEAVEFCARLSRKTGKAYRLPSEAKWEYACRAGTTTSFHFGDALTPKLARCKANVGGVLLGIVGVGETAPVGSFPPNAFGLYDMHGNVWEWCEDLWHDNYEGAPTDGSAWVEGGNSERRVLRGGSWYNAPRSCRSASRSSYNPPDYRYDIIGFRVVCSAPWTP